VSPVHRKGPGGGYWYYWAPLAVAAAVIVLGLLAGVVEIGP
jgi:hypothetical protein